MKKLVLILAIIALNFGAVALAKMVESREVVAYGTTNAQVDGLHIALPNNLKGFAVENLVPLP